MVADGFPCVINVSIKCTLNKMSFPGCRWGGNSLQVNHEYFVGEASKSFSSPSPLPRHHGQSLPGTIIITFRLDFNFISFPFLARLPLRSPSPWPTWVPPMTATRGIILCLTGEHVDQLEHTCNIREACIRQNRWIFGKFRMAFDPPPPAPFLKN